MPTVLDETIKLDLIVLRKSFFGQYKSNLREIQKIITLVTEVPDELRAYEKELEKHLKTTSARFPVAGIKLEREDKFVQTVEQLKDYLNYTIIHALTIYEKDIIAVTKKRIPELGVIIRRVKEEKDKKGLTGTFTDSQLGAFKDIISILENSMREFEKDLERLSVQISLLSQFSPVQETPTKKYDLSKTELLEKYEEFFERINEICYRLTHDFDIIRETLKMIDLKIIELAKTLP